MRKYAYLKEPLKLDEENSVYKVMLYEMEDGIYLFEFFDPGAFFSSADLLYETPEDLYDEWNDRIDEKGWIDMGDPLPGAQHDALYPLRVKGRDTGKPEWGKFEILIDGEWIEFDS